MSLSTLLFSEYRRRVLGLLLMQPDRAFHVREIARQTGTMTGTLTRELGKLTETGVLLKKRVGNQVQYFANRDCPIFEELASILRKTSGLTDVLAEALRPVASRVVASFVFGSMANGKASPFSDVDLMIIGDATFGEVVELLQPAQETLGREINPKLYSVPEWQALVATRGAFVSDVLAKPKIFVVGGPDDLG
jgi:predicted nucleotidyltransferase